MSPLDSQIQSRPKPKHGEIVIAWRLDGQRDMVQIQGDEAMLWRYGQTNDVFCKVDEITKWRGCTGFDF